MKYYLTLLLAAGFVFFTACKSKPVPSTDAAAIDPVMLEKMWKTIDSLEQKGLATSALEEVRKIKKLALASNESGHLIKAVMHENRYLIHLEEDADLKAIERAEQEVTGYPEPARSVMHSIAAQWYTNYLQNHLWELRSRTEFEGPAGSDLRTWGIRHFIDKIRGHYAQSVEWDGLKAAEVRDYLLLLTDEKNTDDLRPTLYDILMHRALDYFSGTQSYLAKPAYDFLLIDPVAFAPADAFIDHYFPVTDSTSATWQALVWYQNLLAFRLADTVHESALLDADLKRLRFVHLSIIADGKDSLYMDALKRLALQNKDNPESALVDFYRAEFLISQAGQWQGDLTSPDRYAYNQALEICNKAIGQFPDAYGSQLCKTLIQQIQQKSLSASVESVSLPNEALLAKLEYRNLSAVYMKLVRLPESPRRWRGDTWEGPEILRKLNQLPVQKAWLQSFDSGNDHQPHATEVALPGLPIGHYALLVSNDEKFDGNESTSGTIMFTVSELAYWYLSDQEQEEVAAVIHRATGLPIEGVRVAFISNEYNAGLRKQEEVKLGEATSDVNGWVRVPDHKNKHIGLRLTKGADELYVDDAYYTYRNSSPGKSNPSTLFFTDRAIYRPGQKLFFKGYAVEFDPSGLPSIVASQNITVVLYDANGQEVTKEVFKSNAYGTFFGHFDLPSGGLAGQMSLSSSHGSSRHFFRVEEYKRPKFEVTFDTIKETIRLEEDVVLRGLAKDYAGSVVAGASAGYRVERVAFRPWWYGYWKGMWPSQDDRQVLAIGQAITGPDGGFDIPFNAKGKPGGDPNLMYRFEITISVTDITGETHEASKSIVLNKQGYKVNITLPEKIAIDQLKEVTITATNSDDVNVKVTGEVDVTTIKGPTQNRRNRLWTSPDILTITEDAYAVQFPNYAIPGKEQMASWPTDRKLGNKSVTIDGSGKADLTSIITSPGYYKVHWSWKDATDKILEIDQYLLVFDKTQKLPGFEAVQVTFEDKVYEPGNEVQFDVLTGLMVAPKTIRVIDRRTELSQRSWLDPVAKGKPAIKITEADRGGVYAHHMTVYNNRFYTEQQFIQVPWSNKELNVSLKTWRDKMEPGDDETWTLTVEGEKSEKVTAEMLLSMYDASLDAFVPHEWQMSLYPGTASKTNVQHTELTAANYWGLVFNWDAQYQDVPARQYRDINSYGYYPEGGYSYGGSRRGEMKFYSSDAPRVQANEAATTQGGIKDASDSSVEQKKENDVSSAETVIENEKAPPLRSALEETVFFFPQINTDDQGRLTFSFKMKEGLTRWKFQALGHTKELAFGLTSEEVVTQKQLMVFPNPPRFFRQGDTIAFQAKVTNLTNGILNGTASLKILDAISDEDVSPQWGINTGNQSLQIESKGSSPAVWMLHVPDDWTRPVKYQVSSTAGAFSDGEESLLPVVTNRVLITETLPLPVKANETKTFVFRSMLENKSVSTANHQYVVEMTTSPAWYAVQALPYLMEYPHQCAEQVFSRLYANTLASHIAYKNPSIKKVYDTWRLTQDDALVSNLEKNKDLKSALLEETPWVRDAMGETQQKKNIALLFETNRLKQESLQSIDQLSQMQMSNGGFPWFPGGRDNWYITQYIVEGFGHLHKLGVAIPAGNGMNILQRAVPYLDARMIDWYDELKKQEANGKLKMDDHQIGAMQVHYLYTRSFFPEIEHAAKLDEINNYLRSQIEKYWLKHAIYDQGLMALGAFRTWPEATVSKEILASLRQRTILHEELGRYWKLPQGYQWNEAAVELQSLMVELFQDMDVPQNEVDELRVWLLKQKQTTQWKTTKATASAIYALLIHPDTWLQSVGVVQVKLGKTEVIGSQSDVEPGTGYVKKSWDGKDIKPEWSSITVSNPNSHIAWGSAYWQYWEDIDKVKATVDNNPLRITRSLLIVQQGDRGESTKPAPVRALKVGDKLIVRLIIETDRAMEFVHLKDLRASGFEPMDVLSGYRWGSSLGYYQSTRDLATHFFIDYLPRGKFVVEYPVTVAQAGAYSEGMATLQSMYAPEFGGHSEGQRVQATKN